MTYSEKIMKLYEDYSADEIAEKVRKLTGLKAFHGVDVITIAVDNVVSGSIVENAIDHLYDRSDV
jgi:uncharacterized protein (DUF39 family)